MAFYLFILAQAFALTGGYIQTLALSWVSAELGGSLLHLAGYLLACYLPVAVLCYPWGRFLDRRRLKPWLLGSEMTLAVLSLLLWQVSKKGALTYPFLLGFGALWGVVRALQTPIYQSLPRRLSKDLRQGTGLLTAVTYGARGLGPVLGGLIYTHFGKSAPYLANFISFLPSVALLFFIKIPHQERGEPPALRRWIPPLLRIFLVGFFAVHYNVTLVGLVKKAGLGSASYGFALGLLGLGALLGFFLKSKIKKDPPTPFLILGLAVLNLTLAAARGLFWQGLCILLYGVCDFWFFAKSAYFISKNAPPSQLTAVMGLYTAATVGAMPLGALLWSAAVQAVGLRPVFLVLGGGLILLAINEFIKRMESNETSH